MILLKDIDDTDLEDSQLAVRIPKHLKDFFALYSKREGKTQQNLVIKWISELKRDHARGNPVALITQYLDPNYHLTPQLMESIPTHINHFRLTSTERLKAEAIQHFQLYIWSSAYYTRAVKGKDRENYNFNGILTAQEAAGIGFISEGDAVRGGL